MGATAGQFGKVVNVEDMRALARRRLPRAVFDFIDGGAEDEVSRRRNRSQFEAIAFRHRVMVDVSAPDMSVDLFGERYAAPFGIGPTGLAGLAWPAAESLLAAAAGEAGIPFCLSTVASVTLEEAAGACPGHKWFQIYIFRDRGLSARLADRAWQAGYRVLVITVDCPTGGNRERDPRNDFTLPLRLTPTNAVDVLRRPGWLARLARHGAPKPANMVESAQGAAGGAQGLVAYMNAQLDPSVTWDDVAKTAERWPGPVVVKGILSAGDALRARDAGAHGIVLSNHGGRQLDGAVSPMTVLPEIRDLMGPDFTILCDSGFRRGSDVIKAVALGADAVLMGRNTLYGVGAAGRAGAEHVIALLKREVERAMVLLGTPRIADIGPEHVCFPTGPGQIPAGGPPASRSDLY